MHATLQGEAVEGACLCICCGVQAQSLEAVGKAASFAAVGLAAGVLMSALAIDLTDAALASALFAAGPMPSYLP
jgi:hypothetical protein